MGVKVKLLYFAKVKEVTKKPSETIEIEAKEYNTDEIFDIVKKLYADQSKDLDVAFTNCMVALNDEYIDRDAKFSVSEKDEISIMPPISAG